MILSTMGGTGVRAYERLGWLHPSRCNQEPLIGKKNDVRPK